jgi:hypothetical protein
MCDSKSQISLRDLMYIGSDMALMLGMAFTGYQKTDMDNLTAKQRSYPCQEHPTLCFPDKASRYLWTAISGMVTDSRHGRKVSLNSGLPRFRRIGGEIVAISPSCDDWAGG